VGFIKTLLTGVLSGLLQVNKPIQLLAHTLGLHLVALPLYLLLLLVVVVVAVPAAGQIMALVLAAVVWGIKTTSPLYQGIVIQLL
jgi:hypothetical protein